MALTIDIELVELERYRTSRIWTIEKLGANSIDKIGTLGDDRRREGRRVHLARLAIGLVQNVLLIPSKRGRLTGITKSLQVLERCVRLQVDGANKCAVSEYDQLECNLRECSGVVFVPSCARNVSRLVKELELARWQSQCTGSVGRLTGECFTESLGTFFAGSRFRFLGSWWHDEFS